MTMDNENLADRGDDDIWSPAALVPKAWSKHHPDAIPTKTIVIVQHEDEGGTGIAMIASDGVPPWEILGLLEWLKHRVLFTDGNDEFPDP